MSTLKMSSVTDITGDGNAQSQDMDVTRIDSPVSTSPKRSPEPQMMKVYLRVRPFSKEELADNEDQDCVVIESSQMVALRAPKGSAALKSSEKGVGISIHRFSFSQIFGPNTTQAELFEDTVKSQMLNFWAGKNALIFSYGVTNAGKTFTIQGTSKALGILPRVLEATFQYIGGRQYEGMDVKPFLRNDAQYLDLDQVKQERSAKASFFASFKEECDPQRMIVMESSLVPSCDPAGLVDDPIGEGNCQFALWVAFFEIYNECVYDLLQPTLCLKTKKRAALRVCDDGAGNAYVKDLRWINIQNLGEACKLLQFGNKSRRAAVTKMNQSSSRSHGIFTMKLLHIDVKAVKRISEFSLCDLAGSERCNKTKTFGERLKEAGNINNSLLILGKCITALRSNHTDRVKSSYIPFRESKLTKLFQAFFCGRGSASMIVNINQCASTYDETLHVMKFSAVAREAVQVIPDRPLEALCLVGSDGKPLLRSQVTESEDLLMEENEADVSLLPQNELVSIIESLRAKLLAERRRNLVQEMEIRKEMGDAMLQQLMESEELRSQQIEELKESYQEKLENTFEMYKDAIKEHAYQCAMNRLEDDYVPLDEFLAEQEKVEALRRQLSELEASGTRASVLSTNDKYCQSLPVCKTETAAMGDRYDCLYREKCALERMCEDKQQLILSLERRLVELSGTLGSIRDGFMEKSSEVEHLQKKVNDQSKSLDEILRRNMEKDCEIASLKSGISKLSQRSPVKTKRGILANIKEAVTSPRKGSAGRSALKTVRNAKN